MAVAGNMDGREVRERLPDRRTLDLDEIRLGLIHGWGPPWDLPQKVLEEFPEEVTVIVFGHSHQPHREWVGGRLLFNPGSLFADRFSKGRTYGLITVDGGHIEAQVREWSPAEM
jgi:putative phosphoesterase